MSVGDICPLIATAMVIAGSTSAKPEPIACIGRRCVCWGRLPDLLPEDGDEFLYDCGQRRGCAHFGVDYRQMGWKKYDERA